ncbi:MAG TPA: EamA family transporter [Phycisphaerae bacterium]|nr:EamA family transporter [Phycisphaerae bacterium]
MATSGIGLSTVIGAILCEAIGQIFFKKAADVDVFAPRPLISRLVRRRYGLIACGIGMLIGEGVLWSISLRHMEVSVAYPLGSLELIVVVFLARLLLGERVGRRRWAGIALIVCGTALVSVS